MRLFYSEEKLCEGKKNVQYTGRLLDVPKIENHISKWSTKMLFCNRLFSLHQQIHVWPLTCLPFQMVEGLSLKIPTFFLSSSTKLLFDYSALNSRAF
jgi:hypothetical protein